LSGNCLSRLRTIHRPILRTASTGSGMSIGKGGWGVGSALLFSFGWSRPREPCEDGSAGLEESPAPARAAKGAPFPKGPWGLQRGEDHLALTFSARENDLRLRLELGAQALRAAAFAGRVWWQSRRVP